MGTENRSGYQTRLKIKGICTLYNGAQYRNPPCSYWNRMASHIFLFFYVALMLDFFFHNYSIAFFLSVALLYTPVLILEAFILQTHNVSGV